MPPETAQNPLMQMAFPALVLFFIFYFIVFQPEKKRQNERKTMLGNLAKNDDIVIVGGIHGTIVNVKPATIIMRIDENVKIEVDRESVVTVIKSKSETK